jgi:RNA polymerase sigma factor (sigma-70 family)
MVEDESPEKQNLRLALTLLDNDESALDEILRLYGPDIIESLHARFTKRMGVLRYEDIEDAVSVALDRLWNARADYDDSKQSLRVWFYCIAEHVAIDVLKHGWYKARRLEKNIGQDRLEEKTDGSAMASEVSRDNQKRKRSKEEIDLETILNKLPDDQHKIIMADSACRDGNASNEFLADELGIPSAHVRVYRGRAHATIRREMRKLGHEIPEPRKDQL